MTMIAALQDRIVELELSLKEARERNTLLESLAFEDPLTGVLNRRGFEREIRRAVAFQRRYGTPVAMIVFDLDDFKAVNDRFGHTAGDAVLLTAALILRNNVRSSDTVARIGGDEFAALLWHIDHEAAERKAHLLAEQLAAATTTVDGGLIKLEVSFGIAPLDEGGDVAATYARADRALYADKAARRALVA